MCPDAALRVFQIPVGQWMGGGLQQQGRDESRLSPARAGDSLHQVRGSSETEMSDESHTLGLIKLNWAGLWYSAGTF